MRLMLYDEWNRSIHQEDGISKEKEIEIRCETVSFITAYGILLDLNQVTIAKGIYIFHLISQQISFKKLDRLAFGCVCIFLSSKLDDKFRAHILKQSVKTYCYLSNEYKKQQKNFKNNPHYQVTYDDVSKDKANSFAMDLKYSTEIESKFTIIEIEILQMIGFDLNIDLPYKYLQIHKEAFDMYKTHPELFITAWTWINESLKTIVGLYYEPWLITLAAIHNASIQLGIGITETDWFKYFGKDLAIANIDEISLYIMEHLNKYKEILKIGNE